MGQLKAGAASKVINCKVGDAVAGMLKPRISDRLRDNLEANAFFVSDGAEPVLIINCDLLNLFRDFVDGVAQKIAEKTGVPARNVIISCTHTHSGPYTRDVGEWGVDTREYMLALESWLVGAAEEAVKSSVPARVGYALGQAHVGYNRRVCWADGKHSMYGNALADDFAGMEGPDDPAHAVLFTLADNGRIIGIIHNNTCHATSGCAFNYISADFPGEARATIRRALGKDIPVLYLQGACGDICRCDQFHNASPPERQALRDNEQRLQAIGIILAGETLRLIGEAPVHDDAVIGHLFREITVGIRMPSPEMLRHAKEVVARGEKEAATTGNIDGGYGFQKGILRLYDTYRDNPQERVPLHALRVGGFGLATVPCECYCQFGLDIKRRSPAEITAVSELTHGALGYCPTIYGILGGGYSGATYYGSRLEPNAGYKMAGELSRMLYEIFK